MDRNQQFEKMARRVRWRRLITTVLIVIITVPVILLVGYKASQMLAARQVQQLNTKMYGSEAIMAPNIQISDQILANNSVWGGQVVSHRYKEIDGYRVSWSTVAGNYSWLHNSAFDNNGGAVDQAETAMYDRAIQTKIPVLYNNRVKRPVVKPVSEINQVAKMKDYVAEVGITFKQPLTYAEIQQKLPTTIKANWLWLGVDGQADPTQMNNDLLGIQTVNGKIGNADYRQLRQTLKQAPELGLPEYNNFDLGKYAQKYAQKYPNLKQAKFAGIIVSGRSKEFKTLANQSWITASSVGATIKRVPYQPVTY
ncbi:anti sigma factor C-terminal domain-containing protein [Lentilactobacillus senioris]|uniref:anti sigma factor C-terminal domain-containing protein n=1 Tax=Lentilactobacillus senioris TaxID=931534 RepID=UPI00227E908C|nr:anti sigma factor C-terminal domain-containing protein [Lentilactobacillus senioris]MCY9806113.1 anti sigma factor C-terminal domain-containing protein [Lentilactobacillus senioris]